MSEARAYPVLLVTPLYPPHIGGCAQYSQFLVERLPGLNCVRSLEVLTEAYPGEPRNMANEGTRVSVRRHMAKFFSLPRRLRRRYLSFVRQNIQLIFALLGWHARMSVSGAGSYIVIIHGSFFIHPTSLTYVTKLVKRMGGAKVKLVLDIRDPSAPTERLRKLKHFDRIITCSRRLTDRIAEVGELRDAVMEIPVPLERRSVADTDMQRTLARSGICENAYIFTANGVNDAKGFPLLFEVWRRLVSDGLKLDLVVAGYRKDWRDLYDEIPKENGRIICLGPVHNEDVRVLMKGAAIVINPSQVEGLPRSSLEALSTGTPVLLPPNVPEFDLLDERYIGVSLDPDILARQVKWIMEARRVAPYDVSRHDADAVAGLYDELFRDILEKSNTPLAENRQTELRSNNSACVGDK